MHAEMLAACLPPAFYDLAFAVCLNPYDRLLSEYKQKVLGKNAGVAFEPWFESALSEYAKNPFYADNHFRPQHEFVAAGSVVHKLEDGLEQALADVGRRLGIRRPRRSTHFNGVEHGPIPIRSETRRRILSFYERDFERFGYDRDAFGSSFSIEG